MPSIPHRHARRSRSRAFTLIEIVVVLFILGIVIAMAASLSKAVTAGQRRAVTTTRLATVDAALVQYVMQQKRLPCPADGRLGSTDTGAGLETARNALTGCNSEQYGVVPWRAIGLSELDATDGWGRRLSYRVSLRLTADAGLDMSGCDPAGSFGTPGPTACTTTCTSTTLTTACVPPSAFLNSKGVTVRNVAGVTIMDPANPPYTGAAYVVVSAGESGGGAYLNSGQLTTSTVTDGTEERNNYANAPYTSGTTYLVDDTENDTSGNSHFDDILSRPSILAVASKAGLAPRSH